MTEGLCFALVSTIPQSLRDSSLYTREPFIPYQSFREAETSLRKQHHCVSNIIAPTAQHHCVSNITAPTAPPSSVKIKGEKVGSAVAKSGRVWYNRKDDETEIAEFLVKRRLWFFLGSVPSPPFSPRSASALLLVLFVLPSLLSILDRFIVKDGATD